MVMVREKALATRQDWQGAVKKLSTTMAAVYRSCPLKAFFVAMLD
jgi:hypothetical protein